MPQASTSQIITALETLKNLKKRAEERAQALLEEIVDLEEYAKRLVPIIEMVEKMPELGENFLADLQPPEKSKKATVGSMAVREKIYAVLREKQLTITEISREIGMSSSYVSVTVQAAVDEGILEKYTRFDQKLAVRIVSEKVRQSNAVQD